MSRKKEQKHWEFGPKSTLKPAARGTAGPSVETSHQIYYHNDNVKLYSDEEIAETNAKEARKEQEALVEIKEDGFIPFPIFFRNVEGELVEKEAWVHPNFEPSNSKGFYEKHGMHFNIYVPSYERAEIAGTIELLKRFNVTNWYLAVDPSQYAKYKKVFGSEHIVVRDPSFREESMLNLVSSIKSPDYMHGTAGIYNFLLAFSRSMGETHYWTIDDDMIGLAMKAKKGEHSMTPGEVYDKDNYYRCSNIKEEYGFSFKKFMGSIEELTRKMRNPGFVGLEKFGIVFSLPVMWKPGTRVYSFYLSSNETQINHLGQHNNDVVTSLELSKNGFVNMLFEGISYNSAATQTGGGLTEVYKKFGTLDKGRVLVRAQPNYAKISETYSRIHHKVDYTGYNRQRLVGSIIE